jgi:hypothetical protein
MSNKAKMTPLEAAAMMIVLESSNKITRSSAAQAYVRQQLIGELEAALRGAGWDMDRAIARRLGARKEERQAYLKRRAATEAHERADYPGECDACYRAFPLGRRKGPPLVVGQCNSCREPLERERA